MARIHRLTLLRLSLASLCILVATPALAISGDVSGYLQFANQNGGYCPYGRDCTGATYVQTEFGQPAPIRNALVYLYNYSAGVIGQGASDDNGHFDIVWSYPAGSLTNYDSYVYYFPYQKDGRVWVGYPDGSLRWWPSWVFSLRDGSINLGTIYWGPNSDDWQNAYWAAEKVWRESLALVGVYQTNFWVEVRGFADNMPGFMGYCPASCNHGTQHQVQLCETCGFDPQARVMHEMGHAAIQTAKPWKLPNLPDYNGLPGWTYKQPGWKVNAWEEAFATFLADSTIYWPNALQPHTCSTSKNACQPGLFNIEESDYPWYLKCATEEERWPLSGMRALWDIYDDQNEGYDNVSLGWAWWPIWDVLSLYPDGTARFAVDEIWDSSRTTVIHPDWRSGATYAHNLYSLYSPPWAWAGGPLSNNCYP
jgi:hypothetical protein